eukprot:TRINITY_DN14996_c0_g1_i1.p1 TRINITY_DN14996_c0_g1~~TRINITY_DN14996_c0_g1_i1.p1  ORF type:complete len:522 (-),score=91.52 TRINITY_DN14996_c0_g1_i1:872-2437(-)
MLKVRKVPRHVSLNSSCRYTVAKADLGKYKRKGAHTIEKYDPRMYLNKTMNFSKEPKITATESLFYDYYIKIQTPIFPLQRNSQLSKPQSKTPCTAFTHKEVNPLCQSFNTAKKSNKLSTSLYSSRGVKFADQTLDSCTVQGHGKEKSRRKWKKLLKRTIFNFEIGASNAVALVRAKRPSVEDDVADHVKVRTKQEGVSLSPHIQKKKGIEDRKGRNSIKVYYETGSKSLSKTLGSIEPAAEKYAKEMILKSKLRNNLKLGFKLKHLIKKEPLETIFDLTNIDLSQIDSASYFHLYLEIKKAVSPIFYSTDSEELNNLDPEIIETIQNKPEITLTDHDKDIIALYKCYISQTSTEEVMSGFWQDKKVLGYRPPCRESATFICLADKFYLFGGYGVDRMNDLWCLQQDELTYKWAIVHPLGTKVPERRYAHCMATHSSSLYIFGGSSDFVAGLKMRVVLGDLWRYSTEENRWEEICTLGHSYKNRMYAASGALQETWIIHGGTDGNPQNVMSSAIAFSFGNG